MSNVTIVIYLFVHLRYLQLLKIVRFTAAAAAENEPCKVCPLSAYRSPRFKEKERRYQPLVREMEKMRAYEDQLEALKPFHHVGVLNLEAKSLKSELLPPVERALLSMKQVLVEIAREMVQGVTKKFARTNAGLEKRPTDVPGFCEFVKFFNQARVAAQRVRATSIKQHCLSWSG